MIRSFLPYHSTTVIYGKPSSCQSYIALEVAFSVASGLPLFNDPSLDVLEYETGGEMSVVVLVEGNHEIADLTERQAAWRIARGVPVGRHMRVTGLDLKKFNGGETAARIVEELEARQIKPSLIVSTRAASNMSGFDGPIGQIDLAIAKELTAEHNVTVLLAGHRLMGQQGDLASMADKLWHCRADEYALRVELASTGSLPHKLIGKTVGHSDGSVGLIQSIIFEADEVKHEMA